MGGNSRTTLIITCSPSLYNVLETIGTLRFGERAKKIKNKCYKNKEYSKGRLLNLWREERKKARNLAEYVTFLEKFIESQGLEIPKMKKSKSKKNNIETITPS